MEDNKMNNNGSKQLSAFDQIRKNKLDKLRDAFDRSKKGSLDAPIIDLIKYINTLDDYVTTSSCSGRFAIFCAKYLEDEHQQISKGGKWLLVEHRNVTYEEIDSIYDTVLPKCKGVVLFKVEPFVLHVECRTIEHAQDMLSIAIQCGFRESGILAGKKIMLGIRTTSNNVELPIYDDGYIGITKEYLHYLVDYGNIKFNNNIDRINLFYKQLQAFYALEKPIDVKSNNDEKISSILSFPPSEFNWKDIQVFASDLSSPFDGNIDMIEDILRRKSHVSCNIDDHTICIYGGWGGEKHAKETILDDIIFISKNKDNERISVTTPQYDFYPPSRYFPAITSFPSAMNSQSNVATSSNNIILFGGRKGIKTVYNDCYLLNINENKWHSIQYTNEGPCPRWAASICCISYSTILLYGGRDVENIYGDFWELHITQNDNQYSGTWSLLYTYDDSQYIEDVNQSRYILSNTPLVYGYKDNKGAGPVFQHTLVPLCHNNNNNCNHDIVAVIGGYTNLNGDPSNSIHLFKISKRYWCDVTLQETELYISAKKRRKQEKESKENSVNNEKIKDEDEETLFMNQTSCQVKRSIQSSNNSSLQELNRITCSYLCSNYYLLSGIKNHLLYTYILDLSSYMSSTIIHLIPFSSLTISLQKQLNKNFIFSQFSLNILDNTIFLIGGGCNTFLSQVYNLSYYSSLPDCVYSYIRNHSCLLLHSNKPSIMNTMSITSSNEIKDIKQNSPMYYALIQDKSKIKSIKTCLESSSLYDKTRKIVTIKDTIYIPITVNTKDLIPIEIQDIILSVTETLPEHENTVKKETKKTNNKAEIINNALNTYFKNTNTPLSFVLPSHYEYVEDILIFPKCFYSVFSNTNNDYVSFVSLFESIITQIGMKRIAIYDDIDCGPMRQSHTHIIYPENADKWVTLKQNGILYSYNIEKVMYSNGNNSERLRMKQLKLSSEEVVADMYCGIGYFSLPILSHTECKHLYAFDWNENSIEAFAKNLVLNHFESKCTYLLGDNRVLASPYYNLADRVLLGLLPSSKPGWKTALLLLKPQGGMLHLHENVHESEFELFKETLIKQLVEISNEINKSYIFTIEHIENVKSYAPHVYHYVFDIHCINNNI